MTNQDATYILSGLRKSLHEYCGLNDNAHKAFDMAISALRAQEEKLDTISRQAVYDALLAEPLKWDDSSVWESARCYQWMMDMDAIKALPSAQPEIVRCKDCKYGEQDEVGRWFCRSLGCQIGDEDGSGFCADAERRTDA